MFESKNQRIVRLFVRLRSENTGIHDFVADALEKCKRNDETLQRVYNYPITKEVTHSNVARQNCTCTLCKKVGEYTNAKIRLHHLRISYEEPDRSSLFDREYATYKKWCTTAQHNAYFSIFEIPMGLSESEFFTHLYSRLSCQIERLKKEKNTLAETIHHLRYPLPK